MSFADFEETGVRRRSVSLSNRVGNTNNNSNVMTDNGSSQVRKRGRCDYQFHTTEEHYNTPKHAMTVAAIWGGLKAHTTSHGIPHVDNARGIIKRGFWIAVALAMVGMLLFNLSMLVTTYLRWRVDVVIQMHHQRELTFPVVTICNMNPVKKSMVSQVPDLENLVYEQSFVDLEGKPIPNSQYNRTYPRDSFIKEEKMAEILADIDMSTKQNIGYQRWDMILDCQYAGYDCFWQEFTTFYNPIMGNCFMFNSGDNNLTLKTSHKTGRRYGLKLILNIHQNEYLPDVGESAGVRVVVHPQQKMPFPQDEGVLVGPGVLTSMGIRQVTVTRKGGRYGNCTHVTDSEDFTYENNVTRNVFEEFYDVKYTASACYKTCFQRYLIQECGCGDPQFPLTGEAFDNMTVKACSSSSIKQDDCKYNISNAFNEDLLTCDECVLPCSEVTFQPEISTVNWPSDVHEQKMLDKFRGYILNQLDDPDDPDKYKRNLLKLEVYYEEFNYENIAERPTYGVSQFLSDIGGVIGLWLGWSIMTIFEFVEFAVDLVVLAYFKCRKPVSPANSSSSSSSSSPNTTTSPGAVSSRPSGPSTIEVAPAAKSSPPPAYTSLKNKRESLGNLLDFTDIDEAKDDPDVSSKPPLSLPISRSPAIEDLESDRESLGKDSRRSSSLCILNEEVETADDDDDNTPPVDVSDTAVAVDGVSLDSRPEDERAVEDMEDEPATEDLELKLDQGGRLSLPMSRQGSNIDNEGSHGSSRQGTASTSIDLPGSVMEDEEEISLPTDVFYAIFNKSSPPLAEVAPARASSFPTHNPKTNSKPKPTKAASRLSKTSPAATKTRGAKPSAKPSAKPKVGASAAANKNTKPIAPAQPQPSLRLAAPMKKYENFKIQML